MRLDTDVRHFVVVSVLFAPWHVIIREGRVEENLGRHGCALVQTPML